MDWRNLKFKNVCPACVSRCGKVTAPSLLGLAGLRFLRGVCRNQRPCPGRAALAAADVRDPLSRGLAAPALSVPSCCLSVCYG